MKESESLREQIQYLEEERIINRNQILVRDDIIHYLTQGYSFADICERLKQYEGISLLKASQADIINHLVYAYSKRKKEETK